MEIKGTDFSISINANQVGRSLNPNEVEDFINGYCSHTNSAASIEMIKHLNVQLQSELKNKKFHSRSRRTKKFTTGICLISRSIANSLTGG